MTEPQPLIPNADLNKLVKRIGGLTKTQQDSVYEGLVYVRGTYERELAAASAQEWEPDDLAFTCGAATIGQIGDQMFVELYGETLQVDLPDDVKLCRRTTAPGAGEGPHPARAVERVGLE